MAADSDEAGDVSDGGSTDRWTNIAGGVCGRAGTGGGPGSIKGAGSSTCGGSGSCASLGAGTGSGSGEDSGGGGDACVVESRGGVAGENHSV